MVAQATGAFLREDALFNEAINSLSSITCTPKGIYRLATHQQANKQAKNCLVAAMARSVLERNKQAQ